MAVKSIEEIKSLVDKSREYDNVGQIPPKSLVVELEEAYHVLPKLKGELDPESYRFFKEYISNTVYISTGKLLK